MVDPSSTRRAFLTGLGSGMVGMVAGCTAPVGSQTTSTALSTEDTPTATSPYTRVYRETIDSVALVQVAGPTFGGQGSGFVFDPAGHVLTNQHVVDGADRIDLRFSDGSWSAASIVGTDVYSDLAVLAVNEGFDGPDLSFVDRAPAIGAEVVAIGSPFGLEKSLSVGVVSGTNRAIPTRAGFTIPAAIQTDAAVNPGNSGGPLVDLDGDVVGVIRSGGGDNIGFAVSAALIQRVAPALLDRGAYEHPYMGVGILDVSPTVAEAIDLDRASGVLITQVVDGGPADGVLRGGTSTESVAGVPIRVGGDVILALDGRSIPSSGVLGRYLALETRPGQTITVELIRDGERQRVDLTLGARPPPSAVTG